MIIDSASEVKTWKCQRFIITYVSIINIYLMPSTIPSTYI